MNIELTTEDEERVARLIRGGYWTTPDAAVHAGLQMLEAQLSSPMNTAAVLPPGALLAAYKDEDDATEVLLARSGSQRVEGDDV